MNLRGQYLSATDKEKELAQLPNLIEADRKKLRKYINDVDDKISNLKIDLEFSKSAEQFKPELIVNLVKAIEMREADIVVANTLMTDLFTDQSQVVSKQK